YAQDLCDIAEADPQNVLFLNLYAMAGDFQNLDQKYLIDHVHENAEGNPYMAEQVDRLLEMAKFGYANHFAADQALENLAAEQAAVPEPAGLVLIAMGLVLLRRRRRT